MKTNYSQKTSSYSELLRDPRWQKKRLEVLERAGWECQHCGEKEVTFHVHHQYYISGRKPWEYPNFCLQAICKDCHDCLKDNGKPSYLMGMSEEHISPFEGWERVSEAIGEEYANQLLQLARSVKLAKLSGRDFAIPTQVEFAPEPTTI